MGLAHPVKGCDYQAFLCSINNLFEANSIKVDRRLETPNQIVYLPNKGETYDWHIQEGPYLDPGKIKDTHTPHKVLVKNKRPSSGTQQAEPLLHTDAAEPVVIALCEPVQREFDPFNVQHCFNKAHPLDALLLSYAFERIGDRWLPPDSTSENPGMQIIEDCYGWVSKHGCMDNVGQVSLDNSYRFGDAFDIEVAYNPKFKGSRDFGINTLGQSV